MNPASPLQAFQRDFSRYLRSPWATARPDGVPERAAGIYGELLFNNVCGFIDACFPVARGMMTDSGWRTLCRRFFRDHASHTPYFSRIPEQFARFVAGDARRLRVPAWMPDLLHYEWVELAVETAAAGPPARATRMLTLNPTARNLEYAWPVHRICPAYRPRRRQPTRVLVYRDRSFKVRFMEINAVTAALLAVLAEAPRTADDAIAQLAERLGHASPDALQMHGRRLLADFIQQDIITGKMT